jgi:serine/threonine protein kinase
MTDHPTFAPEGYELVRTIGRGASSVVWEARHLITGEPVALKILDADVSGPDALRCFAREREAMDALVRHPNILTILAADVQDGRPWLAMELCRRGSLATYVADRGPLDVPTVLRVLARLADGLAVAHEVGVVHCDIKPANVMLTDDGEPALGDFGIARVSVGRRPRPRPGSASTTSRPSCSTTGRVRRARTSTRSGRRRGSCWSGSRRSGRTTTCRSARS